MRPVLHDFRCSGGHEFEAFTTWSDTLGRLMPVACPQCSVISDVVYKKAPGIQTTDNLPREMRQTNTAGHPVESAVYRNGRFVDSQLGIPVESRGDAEKLGMRAVSAKEFEERYLGNPDADAGPEKEFCDDPKNLEAVLEDAEEVWQRAESGTLPPVERPLTEQFRKEQAADVPTLASAHASEVSVASEDSAELPS